MSASSSSRSWRLFLVAALVLLGLHLWVASTLQGPWCIDDAYISFRYARNLARGLGLVWNPGEYVDGYTNFAWVLLLSPFEALGLNTPVWSRWANAACAAAILLWTGRFAAKRFGPGAGVVPVLLLALDGTLARWGQDGLETTPFTLVLLLGSCWAMDSWRDRSAAPRVPLGFALLALLRPDGALHFVVTLLFGVLTGRQSWRGAARWVAIFTAVLLPWASWRWLYYGYPLPNTFYVKVGMGLAQVERGADYVWTALAVNRFPALILVVASLSLLRAREGTRYLLCLVAAQLGFVCLVGGDWMGHGRFILPILPLVYLLAAVPASELGPGRRRWVAVVGIVAALLLNFATTSVWAELPSIRGQRPYLASRDTLARWLQVVAERDDTILLGEIGQVGYLHDRVVYDIFGLVDPHIAHLDGKSLGKGKPGHEKKDLAYSLGLRPTWVVLPPRGTPAPGYHEVRVPAEIPIPLRGYRRLWKLDE